MEPFAFGKEPLDLVRSIFCRTWRSVDQIGSALTLSGWTSADPNASAAVMPKGGLPPQRFEAWMKDDCAIGAAELLMPANSLSANGSWIVVEVCTDDGNEALWLAMLGEVSGSASQDRIVDDFVETVWARDDNPETFLAWRLARDRRKRRFRMSFMIIRQDLT